MKKCIPILLVALFIAGCETDRLESLKDNGSDPFPISDEVSQGVELEIENQYFKYYSAQTGRDFEVVNTNATLRDLSNFAVNECYRGYLKKKLRNKETLTDEDGVLLSFILNAQLTTIDSFSVALLGDMTRPGFLHEYLVECQDRSRAFENNKSNPEIIRQQSSVYDQLKRNFLEENSGLRSPMRDWATSYSVINEKEVARIYNSICTEDERISLKEKNTLEKHPWLWSSGIFALTGGIGLGTTWLINNLSPDRKTDFEKACAAFRENPRSTSDKWVVVRDMLKVYTDELSEIIYDIDDYRKSSLVTDSNSRQIVEDILAASNQDMNGVCRYLNYALYDVPFTMLTLKASNDLKECQGFFDDDEEGMMKVMSRYMVSIRDKEMLKQLNTVAAASGYAGVIELFKKELSDGEFKAFKEITRLYYLNREKKDSNGNNTITPIR